MCTANRPIDSTLLQVRKIEKDSGNQLFWAESLVMTYMMAFGGGIIAPFLLGKPPVMFVNDLIVPMVRLVLC